MNNVTAYEKMRLAIVDALSTFEKETGLLVRDICVNHIDITRIEDAAPRVTRELKIELQSPTEGWK